MSWARVDDNITFHRKVVHAGNEAFGAWMRMIAWSANHLTDGNIPRRIGVLIAEKEKVLDVLVDCELLERSDEDFIIHDYHEHNPKAEAVKAKRRAEADRKATGRAQQGRDKSGRITSGVRKMSARTSDGRPAGQVTDVHAESGRTATGSPSPSPSPLPSEDPNPAESASPTAGGGVGVSGNPVGELIGYFSAEWVKARQPLDGKPPTLNKGDRGQAVALIGKYGLEACRGYVDRFLADGDKWVAGRGHRLADLTSRVDAYRSRASPNGQRRGIEPPIPHSDVTEEYKFDR